VYGTRANVMGTLSRALTRLIVHEIMTFVYIYVSL
jgi:hypothetical protein